MNMLIPVYILCYYVQDESGSVCFLTSPISLSIVMASLWVQRISNGCGRCSLGVTSVVYMLFMCAIFFFFFDNLLVQKKSTSMMYVPVRV